MHGSADHERVAYRYATAADIERYYGGPQPMTLRAVVLTLNDEPAAVIGVARHECYAQFFSEYRPEFLSHLKSMSTLRALKRVMSIVEETKLPVYAIAEEEEPDSVRILSRLGFVPFEENVFRWQP